MCAFFNSTLRTLHSPHHSPGVTPPQSPPGQHHNSATLMDAHLAHRGFPRADGESGVASGDQEVPVVRIAKGRGRACATASRLYDLGVDL